MILCIAYGIGLIIAIIAIVILMQLQESNYYPARVIDGSKFGTEVADCIQITSCHDFCPKCQWHNSEQGDFGGCRISGNEFYGVGNVYMECDDYKEK